MSEVSPGQPENVPAPEPQPDPAPAPAPEPEPAPKPDSSKTFAQDPAPAPEPSAGPAEFPDDWKEKLVSYAVGAKEGDEYDKLLKRAERWDNPGEVLKSFVNVENRFKQGEDPNPFPNDGTEEQKASWRKANNIPEDGYKIESLELSDGLVIGEEDKTRVEAYLAKAHENNFKPEVVTQNLETYFEILDKEHADRQAQDEEDKANTAKVLTERMGKDINVKVGAAIALFKGFSKADGEYVTAPEGLMDKILGARLADGTALGNDPDALQYLSGVALEIDPDITSTGAGGGGTMATVDARMSEIEVLMKDKQSDYYKGPKTSDGQKTVLEQEYYELIKAKERMNKRNAAA